MAVRGKWVDPITYQFSFSAISGPKESNRLTAVFRELLEEIAPCLLTEMAAGRRFHGMAGNSVVPQICDESGLRQFESAMEEKSRQGMAACCLFSTDFLPRDAIPASQIDPEWKKKISAMMELARERSVPRAQDAAWLTELMNADSDRPEAVCFPRSCFAPRPTVFFLGIKRTRCQSREEYELFRESGVQDPRLLQTVRLSIPRAFFRDAAQPFPLQESWVSRLKALCAAQDVSVGSIRADVLYDDHHETPLYTFRGSFRQGFRTRVGELGWGLCLSKDQAELLGGVEALRGSGVFCAVDADIAGHVYAQLTPSLTAIPPEAARKQWALLSPFVERAEGRAPGIGELPVSTRLGADAGGIIL
ncbi:MAG: hypothetical protein IJS53_01935 [Clostridia bacterium]|nr:hypothetical protein [Clostridia bacterium]